MLDSSLPNMTIQITDRRKWSTPLSNLEIDSVRSHASSTGNIRDQVHVNDVVACVPNQEARQLDMIANYRIPFSLGRELRVKESVLAVFWLYAPNMDSAWHVWEEKVKNARGKTIVKTRKDEVEWGSLLRDDHGVIIIKLCKDHCLSRKAMLLLKGHPGLAMPSDEWASYFRSKN